MSSSSLLSSASASSSVSDELNRLRDLLVCPISYQTFENPVIEDVCHHTFEKKFIEQWLEGHSTCPISRNPLRLDQLRSFVVLKDACALLNPEKEEDLTDEDMELLKRAEKAFLTREIPPRVAEEIHRSISEQVARKIKAVSAYYGC